MGRRCTLESGHLALTPKPWGNYQCLPNLRVRISNVGTKMFTPQADYEDQMRSFVGSTLTGRPSLRLGALSFPNGAAEEGATSSGLTKVALFYLGHSTCLSPKALYSQGLLAPSNRLSILQSSYPATLSLLQPCNSWENNLALDLQG